MNLHEFFLVVAFVVYGVNTLLPFVSGNDETIVSNSVLTGKDISRRRVIEFLGPTCKNLTGGGDHHVGKKLGESCSVAGTSYLLVTLTVEEANCHLSRARFCNMPFVSPEDMTSPSYTFEIPLEEVETYFCGFDDEDQHVIYGDATVVCTTKGSNGGVEVDIHSNAYFDITLRCRGEEEEDLTTALDLAIASNEVAASNIDFDAIGDKNFFLHTPKTGGTSVETLIRRKFNEILGHRNGHNKVCRVGSLDSVSAYAEARGIWNSTNSGNSTNCIVLAGPFHHNDDRLPLIDEPKRTYAVMRDPRQHVLSQYFHCLESVPAKALMRKLNRTDPFVPPLDEWLEAWVAHMRNQRPEPTEFRCYNPINLQSKSMLYSEKNHSLDNETHADMIDFVNLFDVVGLASNVEATACVIFIRLTGVVPSSCDCRNSNTTDSGLSSPSQDEKENQNEQDTSASTTGRLRLNVRLEENGSVTHHGSTYEPTYGQLALIDELTNIDRSFYEQAENWFVNEVKAVEKEYGIQLC